MQEAADNIATTKERGSMIDDFKKKLEPQVRFKERDFLTFEPQGILQNYLSWCQNTKEILILGVVICISLAYPTVETIAYITVASLNTWIANYKNKSRLVFGMALSYI